MEALELIKLSNIDNILSAVIDQGGEIKSLDLMATNKKRKKLLKAQYIIWYHFTIRLLL